MTKNAFLLATSLSMMMLGTQAFAASTVDLTVDGSITPAACTPTISNNGVFDFGNISAGDLSATKSTSIGAKRFSYSITCDAPTAIATS